MKRALTLLLTLLLFTACAPSADRARLDPRTADFPAPVFAAPKPGEITLSAGARGFLLEDHDVGLVRVYLYFAGGEVNDPVGKEGLSELAGRVWRSGGTKNLTSEQFDEALESRGIDLGLSIGRESGMVSLSVLPEELDRGLDLMAELTFAPAFSPDRVEIAKKTKKDQLKRELDDPDALALRQLRKLLFANHPRGRRATEGSVDSLTREDMAELQGALITGTEWVVGAVGDFNAAAMKEKLEKRFGRLGDKRSPRFDRPPLPQKPVPTLAIVPKKLNQTSLLWAAFGPGLLSVERAPLELADSVLGGGGFRSRLTRSVRVERGLAYSVSSFYSPNEEFGLLGVEAATATEKTGEVFKLLSDEVRRAGSAPFEAAEVEEARRAIQNRLIFRFRDPADLVKERMSLALRGLPSDLVEHFYRDLALADIKAVEKAASGYYRPEEGVWVLVGDVNQEDPAFGGWKVITAPP